MEVGNVVTHFFHHSGDVAAPDRVRRSPQAGLQTKHVWHSGDGDPVGGVDARGPDPDEHVAGAHRGCGDAVGPKHALGRSVAVLDDRAHRLHLGRRHALLP